MSRCPCAWRSARLNVDPSKSIAEALTTVPIYRSILASIDLGTSLKSAAPIHRLEFIMFPSFLSLSSQEEGFGWTCMKLQRNETNRLNFALRSGLLTFCSVRLKFSKDSTEKRHRSVTLQTPHNFLALVSSHYTDISFLNPFPG